MEAEKTTERSDFDIALHAPRNDMVRVDMLEEDLLIYLRDGRRVLVPYAWYPWLQNATPQARAAFEHYEILLYWPELDEGLPLEVVLLGRSTDRRPRPE